MQYILVLASATLGSQQAPCWQKYSLVSGFFIHRVERFTSGRLIKDQSISQQKWWSSCHFPCVFLFFHHFTIQQDAAWIVDCTVLESFATGRTFCQARLVSIDLLMILLRAVSCFVPTKLLWCVTLRNRLDR